MPPSPEGGASPHWSAAGNGRAPRPPWRSPDRPTEYSARRPEQRQLQVSVPSLCPPRHHFADARQFLGVELFVFQQIEHQQFRRITEKSAHQVSYGVPAGFVPSHHRLVYKSARIVPLGVAQIALIFQDA